MHQKYIRLLNHVAEENKVKMILHIEYSRCPNTPTIVRVRNEYGEKKERKEGGNLHKTF